MSTRTFGARIKRNIDPQLLRGEGAFVDDIPLANPLHAAFVRSPLCARADHGRSTSARPSGHPGVAAVYTCDNIGDLDHRDAAAHPASLDEERRARSGRWRAATSTMSARRVAMVVAVDRYTAEDAAALVEVDYEPLAGRDRPREGASQDGAPLVHDDAPNNLAAHFIQVSRQSRCTPSPRAEHVTKIQVQVDRSTAAPMECRAVAARLRSGVRRAHRLGRHAGADLGARRPRLDLQPRRGQGARHRAECRRRLRPEGAAVLSRRAARADGGDAARPAGEIHRGPARELHRLVAGAHADPRDRALRARRPAK